MKKKILVTGGTGMLGSHLLYKLVMEGFQVRAIFRKGSDPSKILPVFTFYGDNTESLFNQIEWTEADVTDYYSIIDALEGIEKVYHCAANVSFDPSQRKAVFKTNEEGTTNVVNACIEMKIKKLCYVSSIASLGSSVNGELITEESTWLSHQKRSNYSLSKFTSEMEVWRGIKEGLDAVIVNPGVIIGAGDDSRSSGALFKRLGNGVPFYPPGSNAFVDIRDVVTSMIQLMESEIKNDRFTLVAENLSYQTFLSILASSMGKKPPSIPAPRWLAEIAWRGDLLWSLITGGSRGLTRETVHTSYSHSAYSSEKYITLFNYQFIPIKKTIEEVALWYRNQKKSN